MQFLGSPFDFLVAFFAGFLASLTPCVYPLIPVSAGYVVGNAQNSKSKGFFLSLFYVTGLAATYSFLGILAVLTGSFFGKFSSNPLVNLISGAVIFIFGLSMFGLFDLNLNWHLKLPQSKKGSYFSAFILGLVSGLMISPCLSPILGSILAYLATRQNLFYGGFLLLCFSYGMGLIFILIGTFGTGIVGLPKSGNWMLKIKKVCAALIVLAGIFFMYTAIRRF
ncbi:MAG: cytochrome c biogenesis protein CcdA [Candidatus Omnitrophica bacterium]|jgi:thiol:disulfide interchange protein DsbD|nr:cytochrome c biogenesis protein CcdA [Candidatus Omnitrophota bacterium]